MKMLKIGIQEKEKREKERKTGRAKNTGSTRAYDRFVLDTYRTAV